MKLWYSFTKELNLSSKSWYFYIELGMAIILLMVLLFVVPEDFESKSKEYIYLDVPQVVKDRYKDNLKDEDIDEASQKVGVEADKRIFNAEFYETEESEIYL